MRRCDAAAVVVRFISLNKNILPNHLPQSFLSLSLALFPLKFLIYGCASATIEI